MRDSDIFKDSAQSALGAGIFLGVMSLMILIAFMTPVIVGADPFDGHAVIGLVFFATAFGFAVWFFFAYREDKQSQRAIEKIEMKEENQRLAAAQKQQ